MNATSEVMRHKSIGLLLDSAPRTWTSQEDIHLKLCEALVARNVKITLVYANGIKAEIADRFLRCGATMEIANYHDGAAGYFRALGKIIEKHSISLIHACFFDYFSAVVWLARFNGVADVIFEQLNSGMLRATSWRRKLIQWRGALATQPAKRVIAISNFVKEQLVKSGVDESKIIVRHLGVDTERFQPDSMARHRLVSEYGLQPNEIILSTVSVLRMFKHPETILEACGLLAQRGIPWRLFVAGDGDLLPCLRERADNLGIADKVHWLGYCSDPKPLLQASDIFVLASVGEAFGLVLAEAMACGVPVVGSRSGAISEIVAQGVTGLLAEPLDAVSFADAISTLASDEKLLRSMKSNCHRYVEDHFDVENEIERTLSIYDSI